MIEELKQLRLHIDATNQLVGQTIDLSQVMTKMLNCRNSLDMAKAYVGKLLGEIGDTNPYKNNGNRKEISDIEPTDAVEDITESDIITLYNKHYSYVAKIDFLREHIENKLIKRVKDSYQQQFTTPFASIYRTQVLIYLSDARLHLGFELQRIREKANTNN